MRRVGCGRDALVRPNPRLDVLRLTDPGATRLCHQRVALVGGDRAEVAEGGVPSAGVVDALDGRDDRAPGRGSGGPHGSVVQVGLQGGDEACGVGDVPAPDRVGPGRHQFGLDPGGVGGGAAALLALARCRQDAGQAGHRGQVLPLIEQGGVGHHAESGSVTWQSPLTAGLWPGATPGVSVGEGPGDGVAAGTGLPGGGQTAGVTGRLLGAWDRAAGCGGSRWLEPGPPPHRPIGVHQRGQFAGGAVDHHAGPLSAITAASPSTSAQTWPYPAPAPGGSPACAAWPGPDLGEPPVGGPASGPARRRPPGLLSPPLGDEEAVHLLWGAHPPALTTARIGSSQSRTRANGHRPTARCRWGPRDGRRCPSSSPGGRPASAAAWARPQTRPRPDRLQRLRPAASCPAPLR